MTVAASLDHQRGNGSLTRYDWLLSEWICDRVGLLHFTPLNPAKQASPRSAKRQRHEDVSSAATFQIDAAIAAVTVRLRDRLAAAHSRAVSVLPPLMAHHYVNVAPAMLIDSESSLSSSSSGGYDKSGGDGRSTSSSS